MKTGWRIVLALAVAVAVVFVLQRFVTDADVRAARQQLPAPAPIEREVGVPPPVPRLSRVGGTVAVAGRCDALPPDIAPVVEVLPDGAVVLRRPAPLPDGPVAAARLGRSGDGAALVLPAPLADLSPSARAAVLAVVGQWLPERPVPPSRLRAADRTLDGAEAAVLLRWLR